MLPYLVVGIGGAIGAITRYVTVIASQDLWGLRFPYATLMVNCIGSLLAGMLLAILVGRYNAGEYWRLFVFTGFLGGYTTFSSFAAENLFLIEQAQWNKLFLNITLNNIGSLALVWAGTFIAKRFILQHLIFE